MGTKIQANAFSWECHPLIDLNGSMNNGVRSVYHEEQTRKNGYFRYDIQKVRQTIMEHESIFRYQLQELHRLYGRQRELMNEINPREIIKNNDLKDKSLPVFPLSRTCEPQSFTSGIFPNGNDKKETRMQERYFKLPGVEDTFGNDGDTKLSLGTAVQTSQRNTEASRFGLWFKTNPNDRISDDLTLSRGETSANPCSGFNLVMKEHLSDDYAEKRRFDKHSSVKDLCSGKSRASPLSLLVEPRKELSNCPFIGTSVSRRKKKIFGVEIFEVNEDPYNEAPNSFVQNVAFGGKTMNNGKNEISTAVLKGDTLSRNGFSSCHSDRFSSCHSDNRNWLRGCSSVGLNSGNEPYQCTEENPKNRLPWFLKASQVSSDLSETKKSSYFMNLDSLQNYSEKFFGRGEIAEDKQKKQFSAPAVSQNADGKINKNVNDTGAKRIIIGDDIARKVEINENVQQKRVNNCVDDLRHHIDLNLSLDEEEATSAPSLPKAVIKIATTEIDLEAPAFIKAETYANINVDECDKIAAEAILDISSTVEKSSVDDGACGPPIDCLKWFADIICSDWSGPVCKEEKSVPIGMDDFEYMTLKLKDVREEHHHYEPVALEKNPSDDEKPTATPSSRRVQSRRGRQRRDFQRDVLPGLVALSRLEMAEDFQAFDELMKGDSPQRGPARSGRGRKRLGSGRNTSPTTTTAKESRSGQPVCQLEEARLTGWGKRTRRLPRQRCPNAFLSFPVKC